MYSALCVKSSSLCSVRNTSSSIRPSFRSRISASRSTGAPPELPHSSGSGQPILSLALRVLQASHRVLVGSSQSFRQKEALDQSFDANLSATDALLTFVERLLAA
jgi:hypothetical protein